MTELQEIVDKVRGYLPSVDGDLLAEVYAYAGSQHEGQMRRSGDPYFTHPSSVASIIADMKLDPASVCAALMHDVIEDTGATFDDIKELFGEEIAFPVSYTHLTLPTIYSV